MHFSLSLSGLESKNWIRISSGRVVKVLHGLLGGLVEGGLVTVSDIDESDAGGGFLVAHTAESGFIFDNHVWNTLSLAKLWKPHDKLNWVNIVGDDHKLSLTVLNKVGNVVETESQVLSGSGWGVATFSFSNESLSLLLSGLWSVLVQKAEKMLGYEKSVRMPYKKIKLPVSGSAVEVNWLMGAGTLSLFMRTLFYL